MSLLTTDPDEVWVYFESSPDGGQVPLPIEMAGDICESCRYLIPNTPAGCCWPCTWDLASEQEEQYRKLLIEYEARVIAEMT
jgi:hypothetical protein